jgi:protein Mpv17
MCSSKTSVIKARNQRLWFQLSRNEKQYLSPVIQPSRPLESLTPFAFIQPKSIKRCHVSLASVSSPYVLINKTDKCSNTNLFINNHSNNFLLTEFQNEPNQLEHVTFRNTSSSSLDMILEILPPRESQEKILSDEMIMSKPCKPFLSNKILDSLITRTIDDAYMAYSLFQSKTTRHRIVSTNFQESDAYQEPQIDYHEVMNKTFNAALLFSCFAYAAYTIFSIDASLTRGWTQTEIAMRIPIDTWSSYETSLEDNPIYTKTLINVIIYLLGDWLSQTLFQKRNILDFDAMRTVRNGFIGLCFGPIVHEYYQFSDYILPVEGGMINRIQKIAMDQSIYLVVKCSIYIVAIGLLQGDSIEASWNNVKTKIKGICLAAWKFWPLVHLITYSVVPARHRILWVNCVDLVWNAILASKTAAVEEPPLLTTTDFHIRVTQSNKTKV